MKKVTYEDYITDFQIVSVSNEDQIDELGCHDCYNDYDNKTIYLLVFNKGGFMQLLDNGQFFLEVGRGSYYSNDWKQLAPHLFDWCDGEYFN